MRLFYAISFFAALCLATVPGPVRAQGNVLVPAAPDTSTSSGGNSSSDDSSAPDQSQSTPEESTPDTNFKPSASNSDSDKDKMSIPSPQIPTKVTDIKQASKDMQAEWGKGLPNALSIGFAENATLGSRDEGIIKSRLGIPEDKVKDTCSLVLNGHLQSDKSVYMPAFNAFAPHFVIKYDGKLKSAWLNIMAACAKTTLPTNSGAIIQVGDKYLVAISQVKCPAPSQGAKQLAINYVGDGKGQCVYQ